MNYFIGGSPCAGNDDPKAVFEKWMARDAANARTIAAQARAFDFPVLEVDGKLDVKGVLDWVERHFTLEN
jgi:hypothetical protein